MEYKTVRDVLMYMGAQPVMKEVLIPKKENTTEPESDPNIPHWQRRYRNRHYENKQFLSMGGRMREADIKFINNNLDKPIVEMFMADGVCLLSFQHRKNNVEAIRIYGGHIELLPPNQYIERVRKYYYLEEASKIINHTPMEKVIMKAPDFENRILVHALDR